MTGLADAAHALSEIDAARSAARDQLDSLLDGLSDEDLQRVREFEIDGETMPYSYAELFAHLALHERGHHGDVTTLFYQLGVSADTQLEYRFHLGRTPV
jgi:uncharacterized damage-inducible protein DinB